MASRASRVRLALALACALLPLVTTAAGPDPKSANQSRRLALVIGNRSYADRPLINPINDAEAVRDALTDVGFEVDFVTDVKLAELQKSLTAFTSKLRLDDVALFYFSGHGVQVNGKNYLVPIDFAAESEDEVEDKAYSLERIQERMEARQTQLNVLILDACRDNPFHYGKTLANKGLAPIRNEAAGTLIAYAAKEGQIASDNTAQKNGLFTTYLLQELKKPGLDIRTLFEQVQADVYSASLRKQFPYVYAGVVNKFYFRPPVLSASVSTYDIYESADVEHKTPRGRLTIRLMDGNGMVVTGTSIVRSGEAVGLREAEWVAEGTLSGSDGAFDWSYPKDGRSGKGTFSVGRDGSLQGVLNGSGIDLHFRGLPARPASAKN
jgi:hypothetical protein